MRLVLLLVGGVLAVPAAAQVPFQVVTPLVAPQFPAGAPEAERLTRMQWHLVSQSETALLFAGLDRSGAASPYVLIQTVKTSLDSGAAWYDFIGTDRRQIAIRGPQNTSQPPE